MMMYFWNQKDHMGTWKKAKVKSQKYIKDLFGKKVKVKLGKD